MNLSLIQLITIISLDVLEERIIEDLKSLGVKNNFKQNLEVFWIRK